MNCYEVLILIFLRCNINFCSQFPLRTYHYVNMKKTWIDAQQYCRVYYSDLATFETINDISFPKPDFSYSWAWIGLQDDPNSWKYNMGNDSNSWRWSATGEPSKTGFQAWNFVGGDPNSSGGQEKCAMMSTGKWHDVPCQDLKSFVCFNVTNYVFISTSATWNSAQTYCRQNYKDFPTIENNAENSAMYSAKPSATEVWIGLYRVPWAWSDKSQSSFRSWLSGQPDNSNGKEFCAAENPSHMFADLDCATKIPFVCHQVLKLRTTLRMKIQTEAEITSPVNNAQILQQLGAVLKSQGWRDVILQWKILHKQMEKTLETTSGTM
ncbi:putative C-type lectin domain family 20 member A [Channa argus]|uniref:putative C-type lectin domain family 20 member A n=1 Tax=Channa argus TaxID=215402 RepID=UPI0035220232